MFKTELSLLPDVPRVQSLVAESVCTVKDTILKTRELLGKIPDGCEITSVTIVSRASGVAVVRTYAGDVFMFQFDMFYVPCCGGRGGVRNDWIRYRCSIPELARAYSDTIDYCQMAQED